LLLGLQLPHFDLDVVKKLKRSRVTNFKGEVAHLCLRSCALPLDVWSASTTF